MKCAYCNSLLTGENTKSVEHIIPETLGNKEYILEQGLICDHCNNYFSREVEKPFLDIPTIKLLRSYELIPSKKNKFLDIPIVFNNEFSKLEYYKDKNAFSIGLSPKCIIDCINDFPNKIFSPQVDISSLQNSPIVSRFLCKIFTEYLLNILGKSYRCKSNIVKIINNDTGLKKIFDFVRRGNQKDYFYYEVIKFKEFKPLNMDSIIAKIDFIESEFGHYFILKWSCLEFRLPITN